LKPFKTFITGKPCAGKSHFAAQLSKHYNVPHIYLEQVLKDVQNWNKEKEAEYYKNQAERERLQQIAEERRQRKK
jgi:adenylate kinase family enzyme